MARTQSWSYTSRPTNTVRIPWNTARPTLASGSATISPPVQYTISSSATPEDQVKIASHWNQCRVFGSGASVARFSTT